MLELTGGGDEAFGQVDADDLGAMSGEFKGRAAHGAAEVEPPGVSRDAAGIDALRDAAHRVVERVRWPELPRQHLIRFAVVEQQIFGERLVRLVKTVGHQMESR